MYKIPKVPIKMAVILNSFLLGESNPTAPALEVVWPVQLLNDALLPLLEGGMVGGQDDRAIGDWGVLLSSSKINLSYILEDSIEIYLMLHCCCCRQGCVEGRGPGRVTDGRLLSHVAAPPVLLPCPDQAGGDLLSGDLWAGICQISEGL